MKRVLSLVLALVMVLGTLPMAFAADETAGEMLQAAGFVAGDENGNLMEDAAMTRAMLAVLVAELNGVKENAKTYAIAPEFKDVTADDWFGPYVAYAAKEGWFKGDTEGNFNPNASVSDQTMATVMLRALGYEPAWETAVSEAKAMGLPVGAADAAMMTRGEAFSTMWGVVNTPKKGSDVALGVELGKIEPAKEEVEELVAELDDSNTKALGNTLVNVDFKSAVDAAAAGEVSNYTIVEKADTTKEIAVLSVVVRDADDVYLETEALTAGKAYTVIVGDSKANFAGIAKDSDKPKIDSVKGKDTGVIEVKFKDALVDKASAEDVANYSLDREGTIVKAVANEGLTKVTLTVEGMTSTRSQRLTVENVMSTDGVVISKATKSFGPKFDKSAPKIKDVKASDHNNVEVLITWDDSHGIDKATAEDVSNYSIDGLEIISAKATYQDDNNDDYYDKVILTTAEQAKSKRYELKVKYMVDGSTAANATAKTLTKKFTSGSADKDHPDVSTAKARSLTEIVVTFDEENALDVSTALDAGNYTFEDNKLEVVDVKFDDIDDNGNSYSYNVTGVKDSINKDEKFIKVILTVTEMEEKKSYKLRVNNIADNFGNTMDKEEKKTVRVSEEVKSYYQIDTVKATDLEKVEVKFKGMVTEKSAEDATNYVISGVGAVKKATWSSKDEMTVTLTVPKLTQGKTYTLTVNNVENYWGYAAENVKKSFIASSDKKDETQPEVDDATYENKGELVVEFDEPMRGTVDVDYLIAKRAEVSGLTTTTTFYKLMLKDKRNDNKTFVYDAYNSAPFASTVSKDVKDLKDALDAAKTATAKQALPPAKEFTVEYVHATDLAQNKLDYTAGDETFTTEDSSSVFKVSDRDDAVEADSLTQENGNTIEVTFDRPVIIKNGTEKSDVISIPYFKKEAYAKANAPVMGYYEFTYELKGDDDDKMILTKTSNTFPKESVYLRFDFSNLKKVRPDGTLKVTDVLERPMYAEIKYLDVQNDDTSGPNLDRIESVDNKTIKLHFSEKLKTTGSYKIKYKDVDDNDKDKTFTSITESWDDNDLRTVVKLTLSSSSDKFTNQDYDLHYVTSPRDLANNKVADEKDVTSFTGVATSPSVDMVAASVEGALNIKVQNDNEDFTAAVAANDFVIKQGSTTLTNAVSSTKVSSDDAKYLDVVIKPYYALLNEVKDGTKVTYSFNFTVGGKTTASTQVFTGGLEEDKATLVTTHGGTNIKAIQVTTNDISLDSTSYVYYLVNSASDLNAASTLTVASGIGAYTNSQVTGIASGKDIADNAMKIESVPNGDVVIFVTSATSGDYKLIATDKDSGVITTITEVIKIQ